MHSNGRVSFPQHSFYLASEAKGDVAFLSWINNLHLEVVTPRAQGLPRLCQAHVNDALPLPHVLQELQKKERHNNPSNWAEPTTHLA